MSRDLQCLDSTLSIVLSCGACQHNHSRLNDALTYVAQEVEWATSAISSCS